MSIGLQPEWPVVPDFAQSAVSQGERNLEQAKSGALGTVMKGSHAQKMIAGTVVGDGRGFLDLDAQGADRVAPDTAFTKGKGDRSQVLQLSDGFLQPARAVAGRGGPSRS